MSNDPQTPDKPPAPNLWQIISSILAAAIGVQSSKNRERDFTQGKTKHFIVGGIIFTILFIVTIVTIVRTVLSQAGM
ncbi:MAG TPA: DUF2970 domain-containing protein [Pseudomonadales bacterium]|jgi:hypothetical protein